MKTWKTSEADFSDFQEHVCNWVETFGLRDWAISFQHAGLENNHAQTRYQAGRRVATVTLAKLWDKKPTDWDLREVARHEMLHLCVADLFTAACDRHVTEAHLEDVEEALVRRLQNAMQKLAEDGDE